MKLCIFNKPQEKTNPCPVQAQLEAQFPSYLDPTSSATIITSHYFTRNVFFNIQSNIFLFRH